MLDKIDKIFKEKPGQMEVIKLLIRMGISVRNKELYLSNIKIPYSSIAKAANVDRRVVASTIREINRDDELRFFFQNLLPAGPFLRAVAKDMGYMCLTIVPYEDKPGILAAITGIIAKYNVNVIQVIAEDPRLYPQQKVYIIVERDIPGDAISEIMRLDFIKSLEME
jgi:hypothetical protein